MTDGCCGPTEYKGVKFRIPPFYDDWRRAMAEAAEEAAAASAPATSTAVSKRNRNAVDEEIDAVRTTYL